MKKYLLICTLMCCILGYTYAQSLPPRENILETTQRVNRYFMKKYADPTLPSHLGKLRESNMWTRAVYYEGLMGLYGIYPQEDYYKYATQWADYHRWSTNGPNTVRNADFQACLQTYIDLYRLQPDPKKLTAAKICMGMLLNTPQIGDWTWIDAIQMAAPILAKMGKTLHDSRYWEKMYAMYEWTKSHEGGNGLWNAKDGLWWRDKDFLPPYKEPNGANCYWSRGNGWVFAALAKMMTEIPTDEPHRAEYAADFIAMAKALKACQREDGFWNVSLHDPNHFGGKETSGTALFAYGMAWGINNGLLDKATYLPVVAKAWNALSNEAVHLNGFLGYVQGAGKEPKDGQPVAYDRMPGFEDFGVGCLLLAGSEIYKID